MTENLDAVDLNAELLFFRAPRFRAMLSEFLLEPFVDSFPFFKAIRTRAGIGSGLNADGNRW
ncbi:MAG TPA: hypothetical protein VIH18_15920 [Candidatus Binatia bacterium]